MARGNVTTDGEGIRAFVEKGGGHPARVIRTGRGVSAPGGAKAGRGSRAAGGGSSRRGRSSAGSSVRG